jgi:hypothetical protein
MRFGAAPACPRQFIVSQRRRLASRKLTSRGANSRLFRDRPNKLGKRIGHRTLLHCVAANLAIAFFDLDRLIEPLA